MQLPRLREWREARGLMQKEVGAAAGVSEFTVLRAEGGASLRPDTARKIADALEVTVADLMERPPVPLGSSKPEADSPRTTSVSSSRTVIYEVRSDLREVEEDLRNVAAATSETRTRVALERTAATVARVRERLPETQTA